MCTMAKDSITLIGSTSTLLRPRQIILGVKPWELAGAIDVAGRCGSRWIIQCEQCDIYLWVRLCIESQLGAAAAAKRPLDLLAGLVDSGLARRPLEVSLHMVRMQFGTRKTNTCRIMVGLAWLLKNSR